MKVKSRNHKTDPATRFSQLTRWLLGLVFIGAGILSKGNWPALGFGSALFLTGFLKPRRCAPNDEKENL